MKKSYADIYKYALMLKSLFVKKKSDSTAGSEALSVFSPPVRLTEDKTLDLTPG